jgi:hypothetical protein
MWLHDLHNFGIMSNPALNAILLLVQFSQESIFHFGHDVGEREEEVGLMVLNGNNSLHLPFFLVIVRKTVILQITIINNCQHLIHALDVLDAWIEFCVNE